MMRCAQSSAGQFLTHQNRRPPIVCVDLSAGLLELALDLVSCPLSVVLLSLLSQDGALMVLRVIRMLVGMAVMLEKRPNCVGDSTRWRFDAVLMKEMIHLIPPENWEQIFKALHDRLLVDGRRVIIKYQLKRTEFPSSRNMVETWERLWALSGLEEAIEAAGFEKVEEHEECFPL